MTKTPYTSFGSTVRVEPGPRRVEGVNATPDVLDNSVTADHYQVGARDADGRTIRAGEAFSYLDWRGHADPENTDATVFYLYEERTEPVTDAGGEPMVEPDVFPAVDPATGEAHPKAGKPNPKAGQPITTERWVEVGTYKTEEAANRAAEKLAGRSK